MKSKIVLLILSFFIFLSSVDASVFDNKIDAKSLSEKLPKLDSISCKFKQERKLKNIDKVLVSGGDFKFDKNDGIFFETTYPIKSTTSYSNKDNQQINDIILAISNKKYSKLDKMFDFYYEKKDLIWALGLKPKEKTPSDKYISSIIIEGTDYINKIEILMKDGSATTQWFSIN